MASPLAVNDSAAPSPAAAHQAAVLMRKEVSMKDDEPACPPAVTSDNPPNHEPPTNSAPLMPDPRNQATPIELGPNIFGSRLAFSVKEVAAILGVSEKTVRRLVNRRLIGTSRALRHLLIPKKQIEKFLERTTAE